MTEKPNEDQPIDAAADRNARKQPATFLESFLRTFEQMTTEERAAYFQQSIRYEPQFFKTAEARYILHTPVIRPQYRIGYQQLPIKRSVLLNYSQYQQQAIRTDDVTLGDGARLLLAACGICGEIGELVDSIKKLVFHQHDYDAEKLCSEIGDVLWYIALMCRVLGEDMGTLAQRSGVQTYSPRSLPDQRLSHADMLSSVLAMVQPAGELAQRLQNTSTSMGYGFRPYNVYSLLSSAGMLLVMLDRFCVGMLMLPQDVMQQNLDKIARRYPNGFDPQRSRVQRSILCSDRRRSVFASDNELDPLKVELCRLLRSIAESDQDYPRRAVLIYRALGVAAWMGYACGIRIDEDQPAWPVVYIELPTGQVSWHMPQHPYGWDGHTTAEKFYRIKRYTASVLGDDPHAH